jgi:hypothetical protein
MRNLFILRKEFCRYSDKTRISPFYEMEKNDFIFSGLYLSHYSNLTVEILQAESRFILLITQISANSIAGTRVAVPG